MNRKRVNKKAFRLLLFMLVFTFFAIKLTSGLVEQNSKTRQSVKQEASECTNCIEQTGSEEKLIQEQVQPVKVDSSTALQELSTEPYVKGVGEITMPCNQSFQLLSSAKFLCADKGTGIPTETDGKVRMIKIDRNTTIQLVKVTYPLAFGLGQYTVQDSNKQIKKSSPEVRSNGQQIDPEYVSKLLSPTQAEEFEERIVRSEKKPFTVEGNVTFGVSVDGTADLHPEAGLYTVSNLPSEPGIKAPREIAISDINVGKSNYIASDPDAGGYGMIQIPGGDNFPKPNEEQCLDVGKNVSNFTKSEGVVVTCLNKTSQILGRIMGVFNLDAGDCQEKLDANGNNIGGYICVNPATIGIKMTPIFGDPYECSEDGELCANALLNENYRATLSPDQAASSDGVFTIATDCEIRIDHGRTETVKCLWDASTTKYNYNLQAKDKAPNQADFPQSFNRYWSSVKVATKKSAEVYGISGN